MEKIYMEGNQHNKKKKSVVDFSVVLSFAVAFFAIFSIATAGVISNQGTAISYAAEEDSAPDSFNMAIDTYDSDGSPDNIMVFNSDLSDATGFPVYHIDSTTGNVVYCVERSKEIDNDDSYTRDNSLVHDMGLIYIMNDDNYSSVNLSNDTDIITNNEIQFYIKQVAIWMYLKDKDSSYAFKKTQNDQDEYNIFKSDNISLAKRSDLISKYDASDVKLYSEHIEKLVTAAKSKTAVTFTVTSASDKFVKTDDGKFYQTEAPITVSSNISFPTYDVTLSGIDGAKIVAEDGSDLALTGISAAKKFYVRIPTDKVTEEVKKVQVSVTATMPNAGAYYYNNADSAKQKMILPTSYKETAGIEFEISGAPDTGLSVAQTIYFIGLIVLICGIGIVYANAKPVES